MTYLIIFILLGTAFIVFLSLWAAHRDEGSTQSEDAEDYLLEGPYRPDASLVNRIFDRADWNFIRNEAQPRTVRAFLHERTDLAIDWLRQTRRLSTRIMRFHRRAVRLKRDLRSDLELKLLWNYTSLILLWSFLVVVIRTFGPFQVSLTARYALHIAERLRLVSEQVYVSGASQPVTQGMEPQP